MSLPGLQKVVRQGSKTVYITNEDAGRHPEKASKTAIVENKDAGEGEPKKAVYDIRGAGNWIDGIKLDLQRRFGNATLRQTVEDGEERPDPFKAFNDGLQQIHPMTVMNSQLKNRIKSEARANSRKIAATIVEAGLYCAAFHHVKQGVKRLTRGRRYSGPTVRYACDVMMPNGLYGPIFGFLLRLALPF